MSHTSIPAFKKIVWNFYAAQGRDLPWRKNITPYRIVVSEIMLQQTQVHRVIPKFKSFIKKFPNFKTLAKAPLADVLTEWKGLGYNRRAVALQTIATYVTKRKGLLPRTTEELMKLPSIGPNTAASICAFAYNQPTVFIETNIRTVFIHHFFTDIQSVDDKDIIPFIEKTADQNKSREWYYALMDYGSYLKKDIGNLNTKSVQYRPQSKFKGSNREQRSKILEKIRQAPIQIKSLYSLGKDKVQINKNVISLIKEGFIIKNSKGYLSIRP